MPCPGNPPPASSVNSGQSFAVYVAAIQVIGGQDAGFDTAYVGTVRFASTDPLAGLPSDYTFALADGGKKAFTGVVLRTPGVQRITGTDSANGLSGSFTLTVTGPATVPVPATSETAKALLAVFLAASGLWFARLRPPR